MDEKPTEDAPSKGFNQLDLTQLEAFSFGTQWSVDKQEASDGRPRRDDRGRGDRPRPDPRKDRRSFKRPADPAPGGERPAPRSDRPSDGRPHGDRFSRDRGDQPQRGGGHRRESGPPARPLPPYVSPYFDATFYPEDVSFAALAKTIRASCRTFELFDIAKTVIGKHDRFVVVLERKSERGAPAEKKPFYVATPDNLPFDSEEAAVNHIFRHHLDRFFSTEQVEIEPPKGSFQVINKCGFTGELLGPPNYHLYNEIAQHHHAAKVARVPFDVFLSRVETVRDPEVVQQWLDSMKTATRYTWTFGRKPAVATKPAGGAEPEAASAVGEAETEPANPPAEATPTAPTDAVAEPTAPEASPSEAPAGEDQAPGETSSVELAETVEPAEKPDAPVFDSLSAARVYLLSHARDKAVRTYESGRFHGRALDQLPDGEIKRAVLGSLERQQRFPLDTANALRGRLRREGFTIFKKGSKGVSYVCAVKRKFRVPGQRFADSIGHLIGFIETNPMIKVSELPAQLLGINLPEAPAKDAPADAPAPAPIGAEEQASLKRLQTDLRWLVTEGYVTEFIDGGLFAAPPLPEAKPKPPPAPPKAPAAAADEAVAAVAPAETEDSEPSAATSAPVEDEPAAPTTSEAPAPESAAVPPTADPVPVAPAPEPESEAPAAPEVGPPEPVAEEPAVAAATEPAATAADDGEPEAASEADSDPPKPDSV